MGRDAEESLQLLQDLADELGDGPVDLLLLSQGDELLVRQGVADQLRDLGGRVALKVLDVHLRREEGLGCITSHAGIHVQKDVGQSR